MANTALSLPHSLLHIPFRFRAEDGSCLLITLDMLQEVINYTEHMELSTLHNDTINGMNYNLMTKIFDKIF